MSKALTHVQLHNIETHPKVFCDYFEEIIDEKVGQCSKVALSCLQQLVDWILTHLSQNYRDLYTLKCVVQAHWCHPLEDTKVLRFKDGTMLIDLTKDKIASIVPAKSLPDAHGEHERICLKGNEVVLPEKITGPLSDKIIKATPFLVVFDLLGPQWRIQKSDTENYQDRLIMTWTINQNGEDSLGQTHPLKSEKTAIGQPQRQLLVPLET